MALSTSDEGFAAQSAPQYQNRTDNRLTDQQIAANNGGLVTITVDGNEYRVRPGAHSMASLTRTAVPANPPNLLGIQSLHSRKNEKYAAADTINIEGGEVFVSSANGAPSPRGFNRTTADNRPFDNRTADQRTADGNYAREQATPVL